MAPGALFRRYAWGEVDENMSNLQKQLIHQEGQIHALTEILRVALATSYPTLGERLTACSALTGPQFDAVQEGFGMVPEEDIVRRKGYDAVFQNVVLQSASG